MNRTTVKRGIGAVILALIAAALLAFLLKDKAAQRQEVVEIALPGTGGSTETTDQSTRLPTLTTDNSGNGDVIANAGSGSGDVSTTMDASNTLDAGNNQAANGNTPSGDNADGTIIASAAAVGSDVAAGSNSDGAKSIDFSVKPKAPTASSEFLNLDLVNNGNNAGTAASAPATTNTAPAATASTEPAPAAPQNSSSTDQGIVIASTSARSGNAAPSVVQPRLIGEKRSAPIKSASTARVVTKQAPAKPAPKAATETVTKQAKNGYAIQLLATSSMERANNLKNVMAGEGYPTYVTKTKQNGKTLYRVRIGQYKIKSEAVKVQTAMKRRYKKNTNVNRSAVVAR